MSVNVNMSKQASMQTLLIVDDSPVNTKILAEQLKGDFRIRVAKDGQRALEIAGSDDPPDLILLDVVMPEVNGYEVCKTLKQSDKTKDIPIIFITEKRSVEDEIYGFSLGAVDYITKPFNPLIVNVRVRTHAELKRYRDYLRDVSYLDGLTGIPNRRKFDEFYMSMWHLAQRKSIPLSIMLIDIDFFKAYNDRYGHDQGDNCLREVAQALSDVILRKSDLLSRYGGEEFACVLTDTTFEGARYVADKLRARIEDLKILHEDSIVSTFVTVSIGVATVIPTNEQEMEGFIHYVDTLLYEAKRSGRNCVVSNEVAKSD